MKKKETFNLGAKVFSFLITNWLVLLILALGVVFKILVTKNGNFIFHIDTARDYVDIRNILELGNIRLTGPSSAIDGVFNGPGWYYLLSIPYLISGGNPYSGILLMIFSWAIGGYFLFRLTFKYGFSAWFMALLIWFGSPYISLVTVYSFNPNPILLLYPLFIFILVKYLKNGKLIYGVATASLTGFFFHLEMYPSLFLPLIIIASIVATKKTKLFKRKEFWISAFVYFLFFMPQVLFDLRHDFLMSNSLMKYLHEERAQSSGLSLGKVIDIWNSLKGGFMATFLNNKLLSGAYMWLFVLTFVFALWKWYPRRKTKKINYFDSVSLVALLSIAVSFVGFSILPAGLTSWHLGPIVASSVILFAFFNFKAKKQFLFGRVISLLVFCLILILVSTNSLHGLKDIGKESSDPSNFANELRAIDYAYVQAQGKNFKAYVYLPSIIDYPYQYLFWWYGLKEYGYTPKDYAYLPDKPEYIADKEKFVKPKEGVNDSGLVILIKEPDRIKLRPEWEGEFEEYKLLDKKELGPLLVETRIE